MKMEPLPLVRSDALDWANYYQDMGCSLAPSCLSCPLERCRYDNPHPVGMSAKTQLLMVKAEALLASGMPLAKVARTVGLSKRTVHRHRLVKERKGRITHDEPISRGFMGT